MTQPLKGSQGALWVQPDGPNTQPRYLGCHGLDAVTIPFGDVEALYCPDPGRSGAFLVSGMVKGAPGLPSTSIEEAVDKVATWIEKASRKGCPMSIFAHKITCQRRDNFAGYDRSLVLSGALITQRATAGWLARTPDGDGETTQTFDISAMAAFDIFQLASARVSGYTGTEDVNDITFCNDRKCADDCGPAEDVCDIGVAVEDAAGASAGMFANVYITEDGGATWDAAAATPFVGSEDISAVVCFRVGRNTTRIIVARGTADAGNPAEIAYSDDLGATWTNVDVGATNGQYVPDADALFALDPWHIWLTTQDGYIYYSGDGGLTWTAQEEGVISVAAWNAIRFVDASVGYVAGAGNEAAKTEDGGDSWTALVLPVAQAAQIVNALEVVTKTRAFIGYNDGTLWYTEDGGATWAERGIITATLTNIDSIDFVSELVGYLVGDKAGPLGVLMRTIDGGYTWEDITMSTNVGLTSVFGCDENLVFAVGPVSGATGFVVKAFEKA